MADNGEQWRNFEHHNAKLEFMQATDRLHMDLEAHMRSNACLMHSAFEDGWCETCKVYTSILTAFTHHEDYLQILSLKEHMDLWMKFKAILCDECKGKAIRQGTLIDFDRLKQGEHQLKENSVKTDGHQSQEGNQGRRWRVDDCGSFCVRPEGAMGPDLSGTQKTRGAPGLTICTNPEELRQSLRKLLEGGGLKQDFQVGTYSTNSTIPADQQSEYEGACALPIPRDFFGGDLSDRDTNKQQSRKVDPEGVPELKECLTVADICNKRKRYSLSRNKENREQRENKTKDPMPFDSKRSQGSSNQQQFDRDAERSNRIWQTNNTRATTNMNIRQIIPQRHQAGDWWTRGHQRNKKTTNKKKEQKPIDQERHWRPLITFPAMEKLEEKVRSSELYPDNYHITRMYVPPKWPTSSAPNIYFMDFTADRQQMGRVLIETNPDRAPVLTANFATLCIGTNFKDSTITYKSCKVFNCKKGKYLTSGDNQYNDGTGGKSIILYRYVYWENTGLDVDRGSVAMVQREYRGEKNYSSQFKIFVDNTPDGDEGVFGRVVSGMDVVDKIVALGNYNGKPTKSVLISNCGKLLG